MKAPEKHFFTFQNLAERWECSADDIASFVFDGRLRVCIKLSGERAIQGSAGKEKTLRGLYLLSHDDGKEASERHDSAVGVSMVYELLEGEANTNMSTRIELAEPKVIGWTDLRVAQTERDRFVHDHFTEDGRPELGARERENLLKTIAVLAGMYAEKKSKPGHWPKLDYLQVATALEAFLEEHGIDKTSLAQSTVRARISKGINLF